ncbi:MAG: glycosyltransferase family 2 protein [Armatimonadetes bacterium]|nr:glycosyltransferase family 2 protein [Armatimonadota bacterium]
MTAKVSVIMSVYNGERFLREAVDSILGQTFSNFEFIIVDDGSCDGSRRILESYTDRRIILAANGVNLGLARSLNKAFDLARGAYLARMDADDVATRHRLEKQVTFLNGHAETGLLGTSYRFIDGRGRDRGGGCVTTGDLLIRWKILLENPFAHPTVMLRRAVLIQNALRYDDTFETAQDYELWTRVLRHTGGANLAEPLMKLRTHEDSVSNQRWQTQFENGQVVALRTIGENLPDFPVTPERVGQIQQFFLGGRKPPPGSGVRRTALAGLYLDLFAAFASRYAGPPSLRVLRREAVASAVCGLLRPPLEAGSTDVLRRLLAMDRRLPWYIFDHLARAVGRRLGPGFLGLW